MQLTRGLVAFLLLTACGDDTKLALQVAAPAGVDIATVELWLSEGDCGDCMGGIGPPDAKTRPAGPVHLVTGTTAFTAPVDGNGIATFGIGKGDGGQVLIDKLAAVGYDKTGAPVALVVDDNGFDITAQLGEIRRYDLVTTTITSALPEDATSGTVLWRTDPNGTGCLMVSQGSTTEFFVPDGDDRDCDGVTGAAECDPDWYKYEAPPTDQPCAATDATLMNACTIGYETSCVDGETAGGCQPKLCTGKALCGDQQCASAPLACLASHASVLPRVTCTIPITQDAVASTIVCGGPSHVAFAGIDECQPKFLQTLTLPLTFESALQYNDGANNGNISTNAVSNNSCEFDLVPNFNKFVTVPPSGAMLAGGLVLTNGNSPPAVLPMYLNFIDHTTTNQNCAASGASGRMVCVVEGYDSDTIANCLQ